MCSCQYYLGVMRNHLFNHAYCVFQVQLAERRGSYVYLAASSAGNTGEEVTRSAPGIL